MTMHAYERQIRRGRRSFRMFFAVLLLTVLMISSQAAAAPKLKKTSLTLKKGNYYVLRLSGNSKGKTVKWTTSAIKTVSIVAKRHNRAVLRTKKAGTAVISAKIGKRILQCQVKVTANKAFPGSLTLRTGDSFTFSRSKKAKWSLSNAKKGVLSAKSGKTVKFTAKKTGSVKLYAVRGKKTYTCSIKIIRRDGATKADLAEEKAIEEAKNSSSGENGGTDPAGTSDSVTLTKQQKNMMATLAHSAVTKQLGTETPGNCEVHSMDLTAETKAFLLYEYLYKYARSQDTEADLSVTDSTNGEYRYVSPDTMEALLNHLFGEENQTTTMYMFVSTYANDFANDAYFVPCTGDFGDAGLSYFTTPDTITVNNGMICASGKMMSWNNNMNSYIHTNTYKAYWYQKSAQRTGATAGTDHWLKFEKVVIE